MYVRRQTPASSRGSVVLLHGLSCDTSAYDQIADALVRAGYQTVRIDLLGHGETLRKSASVPTEISADSQVDALSSVIGQLRLRRFALVGHSYGAAISVRLAGLPELSKKISSLHLLAPYVYRRDHIIWHRMRPGRDWSGFIDGEYPTVPSDLSYCTVVVPNYRNYYRLAFARRWKLLPRAMTLGKARELELFVAGATAVTVGARSLYPAQHVHAIRKDIPIQLIVGEDDKLMPLELELAFRDRIAEHHGKLAFEIIQGGGHMINEERASEVASSILSQL